jgi:hypothetical protein
MMRNQKYGLIGCHWVRAKILQLKVLHSAEVAK